MILSFSDIMPDRELSEGLLAVKRLLAFIRKGNLPGGGLQRQARDERILRRNVERRLTWAIGA